MFPLEAAISVYAPGYIILKLQTSKDRCGRLEICKGGGALEICKGGGALIKKKTKQTREVRTKYFPVDKPTLGISSSLHFLVIKHITKHVTPGSAEICLSLL